MMKKIIYVFAVVMALASACQKETVHPEGETATVSFNVNLPVELNTKAYDIANGTKAVDLYYAIFSSEGKYIQSLAHTAAVEVVNKTAVISDLTLVRGYQYSIVFWAQSPDATCYDFDHATGTVKVDYSGNSNDDTRDAFCAVHTFMVPDKSTWSETVYLRRPFAQINFGASDFAPVEELGLSVISAVEMTGLYDVYDILKGEVTCSDATKVTSFTANAVPRQWTPSEELKVNNTEYAYVAMSYVLAPVNEFDASGNVIVDHKELANIKATFTYTNNNEKVIVNVPNVPYQRNFRTNIVGNMFTTDVDLNIIIDPEFYESDQFPGNQITINN